MVTKRIDIHNMQVLKEYLQLLLTPDTEIILTENGHPVARVTSVQSSQTAQVVEMMGSWAICRGLSPLPPWWLAYRKTLMVESASH